MSKSINILDKDYTQWVKVLSSRYRQSQIRAAVRVNEEMLRFYWCLGEDIVQRDAENKYGSKFYKILSADLKNELPSVEGLSETSIRYAKRFYAAYSQLFGNIPQLEEILKKEILPQAVEELDGKKSPQLMEKIKYELFSIPWGHHRYIIDKCSDNPQKSLFYVRKTMEYGWSRAMLLNFLDTDLYEREGKALTNFTRTLPAETSDLAKEITKDPYNFSFTGITGKYNERLLKDALLQNITKFLLELGTGFAYVGKEYRLQIGETENFIDLLFYHLNLRCYVVVEVKIDKFSFADAGQLSGYVVACNHILRKEGLDNPTIGLLVCKTKDNLVAQYAVEASSQPLGISEYELAKLYPEKIEGSMPTIEEIEAKLSEPENQVQ